MSPKTKARLAGALYLITIVGGGIAQGYIAGSLIVAGDAAATATNIAGHQSLYRLAFAIYLIEMSCQIAMTVLFYELLKPVSKSASLHRSHLRPHRLHHQDAEPALFLRSAARALSGAHYLSVFDPAQLQALAYLSLRVNYAAETMAMVFFGLNTVMTGYLLFKSTFLPRWLGVLTVVGGLGWMFYLYEPRCSPPGIVYRRPRQFSAPWRRSCGCSSTA